MTIALVSMQNMIDGVCSIMGSDTATLLLLDETRTVLQPAASAGLGGRWRGAPHVRVGEGFAGTVAERARPVVLEQIDEHTVVNPILREAGLRRLLGVPVFGTKGMLGVLHVGCLNERTFTSSDIQRLERLADDVGRRLSDRVEDDTHVAALVLQRSLLPAAPPRIEGLDVAVRYLPAEGDLGGDWYDIFALPDAKVGIVMGDVEGHGLRSAIVMGRLRSALRAYALDHDDPADVLQRVDRKLCHFEAEISASVVYAVTEPPYDQLRICNAGHPTPLVTRERQQLASVADIAPGVIMGVDPTIRRVSEKISLAPGTAVAFYTDGLVERRDPDNLDADPYDAHLALVRRAFSAEDNAETACSHIIAAGLGDDTVEDDVALVVVRRPPV